MTLSLAWQLSDSPICIRLKRKCDYGEGQKSSFSSDYVNSLPALSFFIFLHVLAFNMQTEMKDDYANRDVALPDSSYF